MARIARTLDQPLENAMASTRHVADELGWKLNERRSDATTLVFKKRTLVNPLLGTRFTVWFEPEAANQTRVTVFTKEDFQGRAIKRLFDELGAHLH